MTKKIFWEDPYLTQLDTRIADVNGNEVKVEQTIFYALAGGQESDAGTFGPYRVARATKQGRDIVYLLEGDHTLIVGDVITMRIDWDRRYRLMRLHFAAEIILALVYKHLSPINKIGAHIASDKARIDFEHAENISRHFPILQQQSNELVKSDIPITSDFSDPENERRFWEIQGFGKIACGGTHLRRTSEIGEISLKRNNIGKGKERIEIYVS